MRILIIAAFLALVITVAVLILVGCSSKKETDGSDGDDGTDARISPETASQNEFIDRTEEIKMEEQVITITVRTKGEKCEMSSDEIIKWYETKVASLFDPAYGTPEITVKLERNEL